MFSIVLLTFEDRSSILRRRTTGLPCLGALSRKIGAHRPIVALLTKIFISVIGIGYFVDSLRLFSVKIGSWQICHHEEAHDSRKVDISSTCAADSLKVSEPNISIDKLSISLS